MAHCVLTHKISNLLRFTSDYGFHFLKRFKRHLEAMYIIIFGFVKGASLETENAESYSIKM